MLESQVIVRNDAYFLPRFGYRFNMPCGYESLSYFGRGPTESYTDKRHASRMGVFQSTVTEHFEHYIRPQENMAHTDTHWMCVSDRYGEGLIALSCGDECGFSFNCSHFTAEQLTSTAHDYELIPLDETVIHIDHRQSGIGSNSCGPRLDDSLRLSDKEFSFAFRLLFANVDAVDPFMLKTQLQNKTRNGEIQ